MKNIKHYLNICVFLLTIGVLSMTFIIGEDKAISVAERRPLKSFEEAVSAENPFKEIESYFLDQFPFRDTFRRIKAFLNNDVLKKNDNNNIYTIDGTVVKIEDTLDENQLNYAVDMINKLIHKYAKNNRVYYSIIPDKHYFASQINGYPALDYEKLLNFVSENLKKAEYIDIFPLLELSDYYKTDSHWSQDKILDIADKLVSTMSPGVTVIPDGEFYKENVLSPFYGVYYGQSALTLAPEKIKYLTSKDTESMKMTIILDNGQKQHLPVYVPKYFTNIDPYDIFTAGAQPIVIIENVNATNDKELVLFRDSFSSSIAPLMIQSFSKITVVDIRYIASAALRGMVDFENADSVLFLYSTVLLNNSVAMK